MNTITLRGWTPAITLLLLLAIAAVPFLDRAIGQTANAKGFPVPTEATAARSEDRVAIVASLESFTKAFEARDAKALSSHWTAEGIYSRDGEVTIAGRDAIEKAFKAFFEKTPEVSAKIKPSSFRFLSKDVAAGEGTVSVQHGPAAPTTSAKYQTILAREDGQWRLAQLTESTNEEASITDLDWLIGEWKSTSGENVEIRTTYSWSPSKKFINAQFSFMEKNTVMSGNQVIGVDPATGSIHSWTFETDGGVGNADWSRDGEHWVIEAEGTLTDGSVLSETNILRRINSDTFTWQSTNRLLGDNSVDDLAPLKVTRVKVPK